MKYLLKFGGIDIMKSQEENDETYIANAYYEYDEDVGYPVKDGKWDQVIYIAGGVDGYFKSK